MSFNQITICGHLGSDPELRYTPDGTAVCDFRMATDRKRGTDVQTVWFHITVWRKQAESASRYLAKGRQAIVIGDLYTQEWTDRQGSLRTTLNVEAQSVHFINDGKHKGDAYEQPSPNTEQEPQFSGVSPDDIPF